MRERRDYPKPASCGISSA